jgi:hypothetical protein
LSEIQIAANSGNGKIATRNKHAHTRPHLFPFAANSAVKLAGASPMSICNTGISRDQLHGARPLAVTVKSACKLVGIGNTSMWALIKSGRVKTVSIGRRRLVIFTSLESLVADEAEQNHERRR